MIDEMINTVRAAFAPDADAATKQRAAGILRGLVSMLEPAPGAMSERPDPSTAGPAPVPQSLDLLTTIVEYVRPHLPPEALADMLRFRVPLVDLRRATDKG